jgi:broad specificity phosphatase PhoE
MKLIIVRHGETVANSKKILQGKDGGKLNEKGIKQAQEAGKHLKSHKIDMVFCSPLDRCVETLNNILEECPIDSEVFMSNLIEERDFGEYTGTESQMIDWEELDKDNKVNREMGVESLVDFRKRVELFMEDLKLEDGEKTVLIVSHAGPIRVMINKINNQELPYEEIEVNNDQVLEFDYDTSLEF